MAISVVLQVTSVESTEIADDMPAMARIAEGLRQRQAGAPTVETIVHLAAPNPEGEPWDRAATLWLRFAGAPDPPYSVGQRYTVTLEPAADDGAGE